MSALEFSDPVFEANAAAFSKERMSKYVQAAGGDTVKAVALYRWDKKMSCALMGPVQDLEIIVRNAMNTQIVNVYGSDWHKENNPAGLRDFQRSIIKDAREKVWGQKARDDISGVISNLSFGFWVGLLGPKYENVLWRKCLRRAFPHKPKGFERKIVHSHLNRIRRLRNRIAHHKSLIDRSVKGDHEVILEIISWVAPAILEQVKADSGVPDALRLYPKI